MPAGTSANIPAVHEQLAHLVNTEKIRPGDFPSYRSEQVKHARDAVKVFCHFNKSKAPATFIKPPKIQIQLFKQLRNSLKLFWIEVEKCVWSYNSTESEPEIKLKPHLIFSGSLFGGYALNKNSKSIFKCLVLSNQQSKTQSLLPRDEEK